MHFRNTLILYGDNEKKKINDSTCQFTHLALYDHCRRLILRQICHSSFIFLPYIKWAVSAFAYLSNHNADGDVIEERINRPAQQAVFTCV